MKLLIKNGYVVLGNRIERKDVLINDGIITRIAKNITANCQVLDASGKHVLPGLVDIHVHLREPGFEGKEDILSGCQAAVAGGFTRICCMPNTVPVCDNKVVATYINYRAQQANLCKVSPVGAITKGLEGLMLADIGDMANCGVVAISDDGKSVANSKLMRQAMEYANSFNLTCHCHCEDRELANGGSVHEGYNSTLCGLNGIPRAAEDIIIARDIALAESFNIPVHICHVSTYSGVEIIRSAKARGVNVTAETCPHYFALTDDIITSFDTNTKVNPPIREERDRLAIIEGLKDGTIDCIVTDHAPHATGDKNVEYALAAFGISGIETSFALSYTYLVESGILSLQSLVRLMSTAPSNIIKKNEGNLKVGGVADITIVDLNDEYIIDSNKFLSKGKNTPFNGVKVKGRIRTTIVDGVIKYNLGV